MYRGFAIGLIGVLLLTITSIAQTEVFYRLTDEDINRVYDGDTIYVDIDDLPQFIGQDIGIRIRGIDAPEIRSRCSNETLKSQERQRARQARDHLQVILTETQHFDIVNIEMGSFSRLVADITLADDDDLAKQLIEHRWIAASDGGQRDWCEIIQQRK